MDGCNRFGTKITLDDRMDGSSCSSQKRQYSLKKMNDRSLLFSINEITHCFKKWTTGSGVLKKIYYLYKNVMLQIHLLKSSCSPKQWYPKTWPTTFKQQAMPEITLRLKVLQKSSSLENLEKVAVPKTTVASAIVYNFPSKIFKILYEYLQLLL